MNEILQAKGLVRALDGKVFVTAPEGPLEEGWQQKVEAFVAKLPLLDSAGCWGGNALT
jgi:hypothetical protein